MSASIPHPCQPLTKEQQEDVLSAFEKTSVLGHRKHLRNKALFLLALATGFRITELLSLKVADVFDGKEIRPEICVRGENMKGGKKQEHKSKARTVDLNPDIMEDLLPLVIDRDKKEPLFVSQKKTKDGQLKPINRRQAFKIYQSAMKTGAGLKGYGWGTHSPRKTFCERMYEHWDKDIVKTQTSMGHRRVESTICYLNKGKKEQKAAFTKPLGLKRKRDE